MHDSGGAENMEKTLVVACIPAYDEERTIGAVVDRVGNCVDGVEGALLGVEWAKILGRLMDALRSGFARRRVEFGLMKAREVAEQAVEWGYGAARRWAWDPGFVMHVTIMDVNWLTGFGV